MYNNLPNRTQMVHASCIEHGMQEGIGISSSLIQDRGCGTPKLTRADLHGPQSACVWHVRVMCDDPCVMARVWRVQDRGCGSPKLARADLRGPQSACVWHVQRDA